MPQEIPALRAIQAANQLQYVPTVTSWNRVEGRPRTENFNRALKAEVRDALWMISKQWQTGEFQGEDAASAILAKVHITTTALRKYQSGSGKVDHFNDAVLPLETKVEHQAIPFQSGVQDMALDLRLIIGRHWLKLLRRQALVALQNLKTDYLAAYGFAVPDPTLEKDIQICAHIDVWQQFAAASKGEGIDGYALYQAIKSNNDLVEGVGLTPVELAALETLREKLVLWFEALVYQPTTEANAAWQPSYLEYQFSCSAPKAEAEQVFVADEYYHGHLDWYNLDIHDKKTTLPPVEASSPEPEEHSAENKYTMSFLPTPVTFPGMPNSRWWMFEDWKTDLGKISPATTDINQLMLLDFWLNYANDWQLFPFTLPVGSIATIEGLMVTNSFGEKIWVEAAGRGFDEEWNRWSMFNINTRGDLNVPADQSLLLLPSAPKVLEGKPLETAFLLRDEVANMVWGVEAKVPLASGGAKRGKEAARELRAKYEQFVTVLPEPELQEHDAKIRYQIVNSVPENWIPFVPVHKPNNQREIQLQRAAMPRIFENTDPTVPPKKVEPRTSILREGLDKNTPEPYFIHEEEVPRSGIRVSKSFQRTRWYNGKVVTWLGFRKRTGRGEGHSGLAFDQLKKAK
jgi:hypothetical protein